MIKNIIMLVLFSSFILSCSNKGDDDTVKNVPFEELQSGGFSGIMNKKQVVIKNQSDYETLMNEVYYNQDKMPVIPEVDFTKNYLVAVAVGARNTGGYAIQITGITESSSGMTVSVTETSPGKNCVVTESITYPYQIVKIPKTDKEVKFKTKQFIKDCQ